MILPQHTSEQLNALLETILNDAEPIIVNYTEKFTEAMNNNSTARLSDIEKSTTNIIIAIRHAQSILKEGTL
jgi:fructose/tagatose bisphosphate aldolase